VNVLSLFALPHLPFLFAMCCYRVRCVSGGVKLGSYYDLGLVLEWGSAGGLIRFAFHIQTARMSKLAS
jgi:hypothetical protein